MIKQRKPDLDLDLDHDHVDANDNGKPQAKRMAPGVAATAPHQAIAPAPAAGALISLESLQTVLNQVDTSSAAGRSEHPMLKFAREGDGTWSFGAQRTVVEDGSKWGINPLTFRRGYIAFNDNKVVGEHLLPVSQPMPDVTELPDRGSPWTEQWAVNLKCIDGTDAGIETIYKPTTVGGIQAVANVINMVRDRLNAGLHDGKVAPIVHLEKTSYQHAQYGRVWTPSVRIVDWMALSGPEPKSEPESAPEPAAGPGPGVAQQPRRRRLG